jgi:hypothetical protein
VHAERDLGQPGAVGGHPRGTMIVRGIRPETGRLLLMIMESRDMIME